MKHLRLLTAVSAFSLVLGAVPSVAVGIAAQASIKIEQLSPVDPGVWTMISSDQAIRSSNDPGVDKLNFSFGVTDYGPTTLRVSPPQGMSARITAYHGGEEVAQTDAQQYSFNVAANDNWRFVVQYSLSKLTSLGVTSDPSDIRFRMKGSNGRVYSARTPFTFTNIPVGRYTLLFPGTNGCTEATRQSTVIEEETRNTIHISLASCKAEDKSSGVDYSRVSKRQLREMAEEREYKPRGERK